MDTRDAPQIGHSLNDKTELTFQMLSPVPDPHDHLVSLRIFSVPGIKAKLTLADDLCGQSASLSFFNVHSENFCCKTKMWTKKHSNETPVARLNFTFPSVVNNSFLVRQKVQET